MVSFARNEDELAAVIGHELGHAVVRHSAIEVSQYFKQLLGVNSVSDRKDIFEKYNRMMESYATRRVKTSRSHSGNEQMEADKIGIYAAYAAGYDPNVFADFWSRLTDAEEKGMFSRLFGLQTPDDKRLREMVGQLKKIPAECRQVADKNVETASFNEWRENVIAFTGLGKKEVLSGLTKKIKLAPLKSGVQYFRFSLDGQYILAQDYTTITILRREPFTVLFKINAPDTLPATFSPDSKQVVARTSSDRVEIWDISRKERISVNDFPQPSGTTQSLISPDGKYAIILKENGDLLIFDMASGREVFFEKNFYTPGEVERLFARLRIRFSFFVGLSSMFSPDGRYVVLGRHLGSGNLNKSDPFAPVRATRVSINKGNSFKSMAVDLRTFAKIKVGDNIETLLFNGGAFIGSDRVVGKIDEDIDQSGIFAFPSGERLDRFELSGVRFTPALSGDFVTVRPVVNAPAGVFDIKQKRFVIASRKTAIDVYGDYVVSELPTGEIALSNLHTAEVLAKTELPASPLGSIRTVSLSADAHWLTLSEGARGTAWDLTTGRPIFNMRYFAGSYISPEGIVYADYPEDDFSTRTVAHIDLKSAKVERGAYKLPEGLTRQHGKYLLTRSSKATKRFYGTVRSEKFRKHQEEGVAYNPGMVEPTWVGSSDVTFRISDTATGRTLWTREFENEAPRYIFNTKDDTVTFYWRADRTAAKKLIDADMKLKQASKADGSSDYDLVVEVVDTSTGRVANRVMIRTGEGSFSPTAVWATGKYLTVVDDANRTLIYSISDGKLLHRFFGSSSEISLNAKLIAVENPVGWINIYDLDTGARKERLGFTSPLVFLAFMDDGQKMFVLTADQVAYIFDTAKFTGKNIEPMVTATTGY